MTEHHEAIEAVVELLDRLRRHLGAVRNGETTARDDVANVLHMLVGTGKGYNQISAAAAVLGIDPPLIPSWPETDVPSEIDDLPVIFSIRAVADDDHAVMKSLPSFLDETCLRFAVPDMEPHANWSWNDLVKKVRNKFGGHTDATPPQWLRELRYYPAADTDVVSFLMWSVGETVLLATASWLRANGVDIDAEEYDRYLHGIDLHAAYVLFDADKLDVRVNLACETWASGRRRPLAGSVFNGKPFIFGLEGDARMVLFQGEEGDTLRDLTRRFRSTGSPMGPNRKQRRAAEARRRRDD